MLLAESARLRFGGAASARCEDLLARTALPTQLIISTV
jgi:hypothetical protein